MKKLLVLLLCLVLAMSFVLTSCNKDKGEENENENEQNNENENDGGDTHTHAWGEWTVKTPATCTAKGSEERACSGCTEKETREIAIAAHNGVLICEDCYATLVQFEAVTLPSVESLTSFGMKITNFSGKFTEQYSATQNGVMGMEGAELYITFDENGNVDGYGKGKLTMAYGYANRTTAVDAKFYIEDNVIWFDAYGVTPMMNSSLPDDIVGYVNITEISQISEVLEQAETYLAMAEAYVPVIAEWYEDTVVALFEGIKLDGAANAANKYTAALLNSLFVKTETGAALNLDVAKTWYASLLTDDIDVIFDAIVGEGAYADLEALIADDKTYDFSVADLLSYLETEQGIVLTDVLDALDALVAAMMPAEDGAPAPTLEDVLLPMLPMELPENFDFGDYLANEEFLALSVKDALLMMEGEADNPETPDVNEADAAFAELKAEIVKYFADLKEMTVFELVQNFGPKVETAPDDNPNGAGNNGNVPSPMAEVEQEQEEDTTAELIEAFNAAVDAAKEMFALTLTVNNGVVTSANFVFTAPGENQGGITVTLTKNKVEFVLDATDVVELTLTVTTSAEKITVSMNQKMEEEGAEFASVIELVPNYVVSYDAALLTALKAEVQVGIDAAAENFELVLKESNLFSWFANRSKVLYDEANSRYIVVTINSINEYNSSEYCVSVDVYYVEADGTFGVSIATGCGNIISVCPIFNVAEGSAEFTLTYQGDYPEYADVMPLITLDVLNANEPGEEYLYRYNTSASILFDKVTEETYTDNYENGHNFEVDEDESTGGDSCTDVYYRVYKCANDGCNVSYVQYYTNGHEYALVVTANGNTYVKKNVCLTDGCANEEIVGTVTINNDIGGTVTAGVGGTFVVLVKENCTDAETITITFVSDDDAELEFSYQTTGSNEGMDYVENGESATISVHENAGTLTIRIWVKGEDEFNATVTITSSTESDAN